jgi:acetyl esterase/lipase
MPIGYLVTVVVFALGTFLALAPLRRPPALGKLSWLYSGGINELPLVVILFLLAATLLAIADGEIGSPGAWAVVAVAALTIVGLGIIARRGLQTDRVVEEALDKGLGPGWRTALGDGPDARPRRRHRLSRTLWPFPWLNRPGAVEKVSNVSYGDAGRQNLLDVYRHRSHLSGAPTLVYMHGGGYFSGRKGREALPLIHRLASHGWVCISANYRLRPSATFPDHLIDLKKVIAWTREHSDEYGVNPDALFVAGSSAGGHLAALAALTPNDPAFQPGFEEANTSVSAAVSLYGYLGSYYGQDASSSPRGHVRVEAPPFFVAQGTSDTYSPEFLEIARHFVEDLRSTSSQPVVYAELPGGQHGFDLFHSLRFEAVIDGIEAFAAWVRTRERSEVASP